MDAIRSTLQPLTQNLPKPVREAGINLLGPNCYKTLVLDIDPFKNEASQDCLKLATSKAIGITIVGASAVVKLPQLLKLLNSKSSEGVSFLSYALETSAFLVGLAYNVRHGFPFSTFGETALIAVQNVVIAALVLHFAGKTAAAGVWIASVAGVLYVLFNENLVDMGMLLKVQLAGGALGVASKIPQVLEIWQQGGTGQLSAFAVFNYLLGSASRIFTTLQEVDDPLILYSFISGFVLNAVLAIQMVYYWNAPAAPKKSQRKLRELKDRDIGDAGSSTARAKTPTTRRRG